jgi:hypothetical protein
MITIDEIKKNMGVDKYIKCLVVKYTKCLKRKEAIREEALVWLKSAEGDLDVADWVEFFGLEQEYSDMCAEAVNG